MEKIPANHLKNTVNNGIHYLSTGAGFQPSTVSSHIIASLEDKGHHVQDDHRHHNAAGINAAKSCGNMILRSRCNTPPPKTDTVHRKNHPFEKESHLLNHHFWVRTVSFQGRISKVCNVRSKSDPLQHDLSILAVTCFD